MENYKSNSDKSKGPSEEQSSEKRQIEQIVTNAIKKEKSPLRKFLSAFFKEDLESIKTYIFEYVLVPSAKKTICEAIDKGSRMALYGKTGVIESKTKTPASRIAYHRSFIEEPREPRSTTKTRDVYEYDDIIIPSENQANDVLSQMLAVLEQYDTVRVADFYEMVGLTGTPMGNNYGWTNLKSAKVVEVDGGYIIKLPRALPITD